MRDLSYNRVIDMEIDKGKHGRSGDIGTKIQLGSCFDEC